MVGAFILWREAMYRLLICDDEKQICEDIKALLQEAYQKQLEISKTYSMDDFLSMMSTQEDMPEIVIMDIQLENDRQNGIAAAMLLQKQFPKTKIIFLTGFLRYAGDIFMAKPSYFLVKPVDTGKLYAAVDKVLLELEDEAEKDIVLHISGEVIKLNATDVIYVESNKHELLINTVDGQKRIWMKLDEFLKQAPDEFIRIHQSFAINAAYIKKFSQKEALMIDDKILPVSRTRFRDAKMQFVNYLEKRD